MTKICCASTILSPTTSPEKSLVKQRRAKNSESSPGTVLVAEGGGGLSDPTSGDPLGRASRRGENSGALLKTRRTFGLEFLFSSFSPEKVVHHVHVAEMKDTARCPDGSRAPRAPLVSRETQGTLSPLSSDRQNETRVPPGILRFHFTPKPVLK